MPMRPGYRFRTARCSWFALVVSKGRDGALCSQHIMGFFFFFLQWRLGRTIALNVARRCHKPLIIDIDPARKQGSDPGGSGQFFGLLRLFLKRHLVPNKIGIGVFTPQG